MINAPIVLSLIPMVSRFTNKRQPIIEAQLDDAMHGSLKRKTILELTSTFESGVYQ
jgi:hypothetical protein